MAQNFDGEKLTNLTNFYQFVNISPSKFSADNLPFVCQTTFSHRTLSLVYMPMQNFPCPNNYINGKTVVYSYARLLRTFQTDEKSCAITYIASNQLYIYGYERHLQLRAFQTDQQSCVITYIANNYLYIYGCSIEKSQSPVTSYLFHRLLVLQLH